MANSSLTRRAFAGAGAATAAAQFFAGTSLATETGKMRTQALQKMIDACHASGGGTVIVPPGNHVCGTLYLRSDVELRLSSGARILGSHNPADYPAAARSGLDVHYRSRALLVAEDSANIAVTGYGLIDGRGSPEFFPAVHSGDEDQRPKLMRVLNCRNVTLRDIDLRNSASWGCQFINSEQIRIDAITMDSRLNSNNDGLDLDGCRDVWISNCRLTTGDDAICPKSTLRATENVVITNCILSSLTAAFKLGTSSAGGFRNITLTNCVFRDCKLGAIKILCVDGGIVENILVSDVIMDQVEGPIFIRLGSRGLRYEKTEEANKLHNPAEDWTRINGSNSTGVLRHVTLRNIRATVASTDLACWGIMISGVPGYRIQDLVLQDIDVSFPGGGTAADAHRVFPEDEKRYPEQKFFGALPCWGLYMRHVEDVSLENVRLRLRSPDARPGFYEEDTSRVRKLRCEFLDPGV